MVCSFPGTSHISDTISRMFQAAMNSSHIVLWYTYACSDIKLNAIKLVLLKLIKMTTDAEYVATCAEELKSTFKQKPTCVLHLTKRHNHDINKSRVNILCKSFCLFFCFALGTTA